MKTSSIISITIFVFLSLNTVFAQTNKAKISQGGVCNGWANYLPKPEYPKEAKAKNINGQVSVQLLVDEKGNVLTVKTVSGHPVFRSSVETAALKAKFTDYQADKSEKMSCVLTYYFNPKGEVDTGVENKDLEQKENNKGKPRICTGGVRNSVATYFPQPNYPKEAQDKNIIGVVNVKISIDEEGNVTSAEACSGHPLLQPEAEKAAMKAKFKPTKLSGQPVKVSGILVYRFKPDSENHTKTEKTNTIGHLPPNAKPIFAPQPKYPTAAKITKISGKVSVEILIDEDGNIEEAKAVSGHPLLRAEAEKAARETKFEPITLSGNPVKARSVIVYDFKR